MTRRAPRGRGSVYEDRARGRWVAELNHEGRRYRRMLPTEAAALEALDELRAEVRRGIEPGPRPTVEAFLREWLDSLSLRPRTIETYRSYAEQHLIPAIGGVRLDRLTPFHVERTLKALAGELSPRSVNHARAVLRNALRRAEQYGYVERNVARLVDPVRVPNVERQILTPEQTRVLRESFRGDRLEALFVIAMTLGLRQSELLGLRWKDVVARAQDSHLRYRGAGEFRDQSPLGTTQRAAQRLQPDSASAAHMTTIHIRQTLHRVEGAFAVADPKSRRSRRDVPVTEEIAALLRARRREQRAEYLASGARPDHDLVFTTPGGSPLVGTSLTSALRRRQRALGLTRQDGKPLISFHDLRHIAATQLQARGFTLREAQTLLGHASIVTTADTYSHSDAAELARKMRGVSS